ncbi:bifunctional 2-keto-4-hydroxyglutarate aldolase/2-keto-3-deoxy-6-phosphogluconate aldolase [Paenibacillus marinisediminis]
MNKYEVLQMVEQIGVVAIVRANTVEEAKQISIACAKGGIPLIEVTYTIPGATEVIRELNEEEPSLIVGAGTVLDAVTARIAILAGAKFVVSPYFDQEVAEMCNLYRIPYMAGCMTIEDIVRAMKAGCDVIKLFPGSAYSPSFVKDIKGPLPHAQIMPTGGVDLNNVGEWIRHGVTAVGAGSQLTKGSPEQIRATAEQFVAKVNEARSRLKAGIA